MNRNIYATDGEYSLFVLGEQDKENYIELLVQLYGEDSSFFNVFPKDILWEQALYGETKYFSIYSVDGSYCGSIEFQNPTSSTPEIGINLLVEKRNKGIAPRVVKLLAKRFMEDNYVECFLVTIRTNNFHSRHVFEKLGAILMSDSNIFDSSLIENLEQECEEKKNQKVQEILEKISDKGAICVYILLPELFK